MTEYRALSPIEAIRTRPGMYIGSVETPNHLPTEVLDNSLDEVANGFATNCRIYFDLENNHCWVSDNGRGLRSYQMEDANGNYDDSIILLCTASHTGSKFDNIDYKTLIGTHGIGLKAVNALSKWLIIRTRDRENKSLVNEYIFQESELYSRQTYEDHDEKDQWSTVIGFEPDPQYFDNGKFLIKEFADRLILAQAKFPNCDFYFNDKKLTKRSFEDYVRKVLNLEIDEKVNYINYVKEHNNKIEIYFNYQKNQNINVIGDVNLRQCDGTYLTSVKTILKNTIQEKLGKKFESINSDLFLMGLNLYVSLTIPEPKFDSQHKSRMTLNVRDSLVNPIKDKIKEALDHGTLETIKNNIENKLEKKFVSSQTTKKTRISAANKLKDCTKTPGKILYIVEGDSALAPLKQIRDIHTEAIYPLKGKVLNVENASLEKIQKNKEITDLIESLGPKSSRRYESLKLLCDADEDGRHIIVLMLLVLLKFADDYIKDNKVSIILPPLYGATKGKNFYPIYNHDDLVNYNGYEIMRFKGLGEMSPKKLKASIDANVEYVVQYPDNKQQLDTLLNIIKDTNYKKSILKKKHINFETLLNKVI